MDEREGRERMEGRKREERGPQECSFLGMGS